MNDRVVSGDRDDAAVERPPERLTRVVAGGAGMRALLLDGPRKGERRDVTDHAIERGELHVVGSMSDVHVPRSTTEADLEDVRRPTHRYRLRPATPEGYLRHAVEWIGWAA